MDCAAELKAVAFALTAGFTLTGCIGTGVSSAAPPTVICGTTLNDSPGGAVVDDASRPMTVTAESVNGIYLRLVPDCAHGASVSFPATAATKIGEARADDGLLAAIVLRPRTKKFDIGVTAPDGARFHIEVRLG